MSKLLTIIVVMVLSASMPSAWAQPGDNCANPIVIPSLPYCYPGTTAGYTDDYTPPCAGSGSPDVVFSYTSISSQVISAGTLGVPYYFDTVIHIWQGCPPNGTLVCCNDDWPGPGYHYQSCCTFQVTAGSTYYIIVDGFSASSFGPFSLHVAPGPTCSPCDTLQILGRCCYCDSLGHHCTMNTQSQCAVLFGNWDGTQTCASPCSTFSELSFDTFHVTLQCINGAISPNPFPLGLILNNNGQTSCSNIVVTVSGGSGPGGLCTILGSPYTYVTLGPQSGAAPPITAQLTTTNPGGGCLYFTAMVTSSDCCGPLSPFTYCIQVPSCTCRVACATLGLPFFAEGEPCPNLPDNYNGGCNSTPPAYQPHPGGFFGSSICGTSFANTSFRDTDWFVKSFSFWNGHVRWYVKTEFAAQLYILRPVGPCPSLTVVAQAATTACGQTALITLNLCQPSQAGIYYFFIAPSTFTNLPCAQYVSRLRARPCWWPNLVISYFSGNVRLNWPADPDSSTLNFMVYRSLSPDVPISPENLIATTTDTTYLDSGVVNQPSSCYFYAITVQDSDTAGFAPDVVGTVEPDDGIPFTVPPEWLSNYPQVPSTVPDVRHE